jgi:uncharacterized membrane protein YbaN (DUF454 family)
MTESESPRGPKPERLQRRRHIAVLLWRALALLSLALGVLGAVLPVLPTTPFLLVSAWAASKGWPAFERWLLAHPRLGPPVHRWRDHGAVPRRAKWAASIMMVGSAVVLQWFGGIALWVRIAVPVMMACVAVWLWLRPDA